MTTLCFDFGNTRRKYAVFNNGSFAGKFVLQGEETAAVEEAVRLHNPSRAILSSVIDHSPATEAFLKQHTNFHLLSYASKLPVTSPVGKPHTIGADRLAMVVAAVNLFPGQHNLVIGLGTCITYNFVNKFSEFIGGSISPGMEMRFKSLEHYTARLPLVQPDWNFPLLAYDTRTNIQSGVIAGTVKEIEGMVDLYEEKFRNFNVHLTGGDLAFFGSVLKKKIFADPFLIFKGLYAICEYNLPEI